MEVKLRRLKVGYLPDAYRSNNSKPQIRLAGTWLLRDGGFAVGDRVQVTIQRGRLVIEKVGE